MKNQKQDAPHQKKLDSEKSTEELNAVRNKHSETNQEGTSLEYTPQENQFADGKGTQLDEEIAPNREDVEDELAQQVEGTFEDQDFGEDQSDEQSKPEHK